MTRKDLQEKINSYIKKQVREQQSGAIAGVGMGHTGPKPKKEQKIYQKPPKSGKGVPSVFTKGADDISAYTKLGYREVKPSEMIDAAYLWAGKGGLKEGVEDESSFCKRGAKTSPLTDEQLNTIRDIMIKNPTEEQSRGIQNILVKSMVGLLCRSAISVREKYKNWGVTLDDLISAGLDGIARSFNKIDWDRETKPQTYLNNIAYGYMINAAKKATKRGVSGLGDEGEAPSMMKLDAPISGKDGDDMTAYDLIGGSFDNEFEEADFMERLYKSIKPGIKMQLKSGPLQLQTLQNFLGIDENGEYTGVSISIPELAKKLNVNHVQIRNWNKKYADYLINLKKKRPELFNENKNKQK